MNELIALNQSAINGELQQTVNARELHAFLESKQEFSTWIKNRIEQYGFVENQDFCSFHKIVERAKGSFHTCLIFKYSHEPLLFAAMVAANNNLKLNLQ